MNEKNSNVGQSVLNVSCKKKDNTSLYADPSIGSSEREVDLSAMCYAEFSDGYSFRNLIEYLRLTNLNGAIRFYKDCIKYEQSNEDSTILNHFEIHTYELTDYKIESRTDEVIISVNLAKFRNVTKNIGKKDRASLYKLPNDPNLYVQILNTNSQCGGEPSGLFPVETFDGGYTVYKYPTYKRKENQPNCTIYQAEFAKMCSSMQSVKSSYVAAHAMEKGIIFKGISASGSTSCIKDFGKIRREQEKKIKHRLRGVNQQLNIINNPNTVVRAPKAPGPRIRIAEYGEIERYCISMPTIRGLGKLNNLSPMGTIKIYVEKHKPLKLICSIGGYGKLTIHIRSFE